jgi:hypothetical protein
MKLIKARTRGLDALTESRWFDLNPHLNLFQFPEQQHGRHFLRILQTINPTYAIETVDPFAGFPEYTEQDGHTRHVNPAKRTVALAVFSATPRLVKDLAAISPLLFETDRIEVGRRLDYSRWINFVELASSTRWSEISTDMQTLLEAANRLVPGRAHLLSDVIHDLKPADRIKDKLKDQLAHWLRNLPSELWESSRQLIETTLTAVRRADHFHSAREIVQTRMPLFVVIGGPGSSAGKLDRTTTAGLEQDSASLQHLLQLISERAKALGEQSKSDERAFLKELNGQLRALQPLSMMMRIERSATGELLIINDKPVPRAADGPLFSLRQMQAKACLAVALSRIAYQTEAILLFDEPERGFPETLHGELTDFVINIAKTSQCLYCFSEADIFPADAAGRQYSAADLEMITG